MINVDDLPSGCNSDISGCNSDMVVSARLLVAVDSGDIGVVTSMKV